MPKKKSLIKDTQDRLWEECKRITRKRYINEDGTWSCYTCGKNLDSPIKCQTGHFIPKASGGALLKYNLDNLRPQCFRCNIDLSGNGAVFYDKLRQDKGQEYIDNLFKLKNQTTKAIDHYIQLLEEYKNL